ncbi:MAG: hypothetical protein IPN68_16805 [Bacteroidetes bacterium]|nr:hypothetical protein [Bacteroidota bacterium]
MKSEKAIISNLKNLFELLLSENKILFPSVMQQKHWEKVLEKWIKDRTIPLFARKASGIRGQAIEHIHSRDVIKTDNTPAHWVFRNCVLNSELPNVERVKKEWDERKFPIAIMIKKTEKEFLIKSQVAANEFRLGKKKLYVAHLDKVALPRNLNLPMEQFINHHRRFLSLQNMYAIDIEFYGLTHVKIFNDIVKEHKQKIGLK